MTQQFDKSDFTQFKTDGDQFNTQQQQSTPQNNQNITPIQESSLYSMNQTKVRFPLKQSEEFKLQKKETYKFDNKIHPQETIVNSFKNYERQKSKIPVRHKSNKRITMRIINPNQVVNKDSSSDSEPSPLMGFSNKTWQNNALNILLKVLKFIAIITKANYQTRFKLLKKPIFEVIDDQSSDYDYYKFKNFFKYEVHDHILCYLNQKPSNFSKTFYKFKTTLQVPLERLQLFKYFKKNTFLLKPEDLFTIIWNVYILIILTINVFFISLRLSFNVQSENSIIFDQIPSYSFLLEVILKFNTCYYSKGNLVTNRSKIAKHYLKTSFLQDIIVLVPFFISLQFQLDYLDLILFLKIFQIRKLSDSLFDRLELTSSQTAIFDLLKLCYMIILVAHCCACLWFVIGTTGAASELTWVKSQGIEDDDWTSQYFNSFYWSIVTMTTIGYGDITPKNLRERIFVIGITLIACGVFAYSINNIGNIFGEMSKKNSEYRTNMNTLKKYLRKNSINKELQEKILRYFEYIWGEENDDIGDNNDFLIQLPQHLQEEMHVDINYKILKSISFFRDNFSVKFLQKLSKRFQLQKYGPDEVIFTADQKCQNLYILNRGEVQYFTLLGEQEKIVKVLETIKQPNSTLGQLSFFQNQAYHLSARTSKVSQILRISQEDFLDLLHQYPADLEKFCFMKDQIRFSNRLDEINICCRACNKTTHTIKECPQLQIKQHIARMVQGGQNKTKILLNYRRNVPQDRNPKQIQRTNEQRRVNSFLEQINIEESVVNYIVENFEEQNEFSELKQYLMDKQENNNNNDGIKTPSRQSMMKIKKMFKKFTFEDKKKKWNNLKFNIEENYSPSPRLRRISYNEGMIMNLAQPNKEHQMEDELKGVRFSMEELDKKDNKVRGQYPEIFYGFEEGKQFVNYYPNFNLNEIIQQYNIQLKQKDLVSQNNLNNVFSKKFL